MDYNAASDDNVDSSKNSFDKALFWWIITYIKDKKWLFMASFALVLLGTLLSLLGPWMSKKIIDDSIVKQDVNGLLILVTAFAAIHLFTFIHHVSQMLVTNLIGQKILLKLRTDIFQHILKLPKAYFDVTPTGKIMTRVTSDVEALNELISSGLVNLLGDIVLLIGIIVFLFIISPKLAGILILLIPVFVAALRIFRNKATKYYRLERTINAKINGFLQETISGMSIIQLFKREPQTLAEFTEHNQDYYTAVMETTYINSVFFPFVSFLSILSKAIVIWYGAFQFAKGDLTLGDIVAFLGLVEMFYGPLRNISEKYDQFQSAMAALEKVAAILRLPPAPEYTQNKAKSNKTIKGEIEFKNVWFAYKSDNWVIKNLSFKVIPGENIAIVGHTGSGKTTIINLLTRFYEIQKGEILIDGISINDWEINTLREQIGIVLQDVFLFSGTVADNISLHQTQITEDKITTIIDLLGANALINSLPNLLQTKVFERGKSLSLGQRQLLAFARTMIREPKVLILDEATSNVDTETEQFIKNATQIITKGRTSIIIAHRLSTIKNADKIMVIHKGELRECGSHDQLIAESGIYKTLYELQYKEPN